MPTRIQALTFILILAFATGVSAADFTIVNGQVVTTQQTLGNDEQGIIEQGGQINTINTAAINAPGDNV